MSLNLKETTGDVLFSTLTSGRQAHFGRKSRGSGDWAGSRSISRCFCHPNSGHCHPSAKVRRPPRDKTIRSKQFCDLAYPNPGGKTVWSLASLITSARTSLDLLPPPHRSPGKGSSRPTYSQLTWKNQTVASRDKDLGSSWHEVGWTSMTYAFKARNSGLSAIKKEVEIAVTSSRPHRQKPGFPCPIPPQQQVRRGST